MPPAGFLFISISRGYRQSVLVCPWATSSFPFTPQERWQEDFCSAFPDRLAKVGYGIDYELTNEGRMFEDLIVCFSVGDGT